MSIREVGLKAKISHSLLSNLEKERRFLKRETFRGYVRGLSRVLKVFERDLISAWEASNEAGVQLLPQQLFRELVDVEITADLLTTIATEVAKSAQPLTLVGLLTQIQLHAPKQ